MIVYVCVSYFLIGMLIIYVRLDRPNVFVDADSYAQFFILFLVSPIIVPVVILLTIVNMMNMHGR